ncbi:CrcB protein [Sphingomonas jejuensis]|uniref:Fluoride-specific ion channel FluC n=1 Tax=Sphingomonas jejuensis TaxID=904715 RepID=A0ABX0XPI6_9SPHN|nr:fluoride efflux transporter CrcB [Sphingomonas jejuensis]NJC34704.1 CrcB protein [Sphingomonas jejuensis]
MQPLFLVAAGGAIGAAARYGVGTAALRLFGPGFPWGTLAVNLAGGLAMGLVAGAIPADARGTALRLFLAVGVLGGFTTFSAFSLEVVAMLERGAIGPALAYVGASVLGAVVLLWIGLHAVRVAA